MAPELRNWQKRALARWIDAGHRGIVSVVTGGGKTVFALACVRAFRPDTTLIVVPTLALLDQWWEEVCAFFGLALDEVQIVEGRGRIRRGTINIAVLNTAAKLNPAAVGPTPLFLIVDECHKAASEKFRKILSIKSSASLGLSATPERPYDDLLNEVLVPCLGDVIFTYSYADALRDGVIVPFHLRNIVFELEPERQEEYDRLTKRIARTISEHGVEAPEAVGVMLRRARVLNLSLNRVRLAIKLALTHRGQRTLIFHEDIEACDVISQLLREVGLRAGLYHSKMTMRERVVVLAAFRGGGVDALVTCRALDEGFNVPETEIGIIAASTATRRQRIQRLGRILRPARGKEAATVYTLVATEPEVGRLQQEEDDLEGVADVEWARA
ncbi:MAG TPA: DEAD/DEAH box helicase [Thermoanaerobaculia bacterium]|nr:DEAD/DEAH box helicase [Thermoanaerobaculia bacterium]